MQPETSPPISASVSRSISSWSLRPAVSGWCSNRAIAAGNHHSGFSAKAQTDALAARPEYPCGSEVRSEEHTSELQSRGHLVCRLLLEKKKQAPTRTTTAVSSAPTMAGNVDSHRDRRDRERSADPHRRRPVADDSRPD